MPACHWCKAEFAYTGKMGRPLKYCGDTCREKARNWQAKMFHAVGEVRQKTKQMYCRQCGIEIGQSSLGRVKHYCSGACAQAYRKAIK